MSDLCILVRKGNRADVDKALGCRMSLLLLSSCSHAVNSVLVHACVDSVSQAGFA